MCELRRLGGWHGSAIEQAHDLGFRNPNGAPQTNMCQAPLTDPCTNGVNRQAQCVRRLLDR